MADPQTEYEFELPLGYVDRDGTRHRRGTMRLSSEADEPLPMEDPRVQSDPAYLTVIILARVVTRLGSMPTVDTDVIEKLEPADLAYLQERYDHIHQRRGGAPGDS